MFHATHRGGGEKKKLNQRICYEKCVESGGEIFCCVRLAELTF